MPSELELSFAQNWSLWFVLAVTAVVLLSVLFFYRRAAATVSRRPLLPLVLLRVAAMTALLLCLFRPVISYQRTRLQQSELLLLLDRSKSMTIRDFPNQPSRFERGREALMDRRGRLHDILKDFQAHWCVFGSHVQRLEGRKALDRVQADAQATDLVTSVRGALARVEKRDVAGVVLLTDGIHNAATNAAKALPEEGVPIYAVAVGSHLRQQANYKDIRISKVDAKRSVPLESLSEIGVYVDAINYPDRVVPVLLKEGEKELARSRLVLDNNRGSQKVTLSFIPKRKGEHDLTVLIPVDPAERIQENNQQAVPVFVTDPKIKVLYVEGVVRPEYREVRRTLEYDPNVQLISLVKIGPNLFYQQGRIKDIELTGFPKDLELLKRFDVIIIGSLDRSHLSTDQMVHLKKVIEAGGGLMMLGGTHAYGPGGYAGTPIEEVLPVYCGGRDQKQEREPFLPALTPEGLAHPIFAGQIEFFRGLQQRPDKERLMLLGCSAVPKPKPAASVLMHHPQRKNANGHLILVAVHKYGSGRVIASTIDSTWKWYRPLRGLGKESPYVKYWGQMVRWLAGSDQVRMAEGAGVVAYTDKHHYEPGATVKVYARITDAQGQATNHAAVTAQMVRLRDKQTSTHQVSYTFGTRGEYEAEISPPEPGRYELTLKAAIEQKPLGEAKLKFRVGTPQKEFEKLDLNEELLKRIATRTGGAYFTLLGMDQLADTLRERSREKMIYNEIRLWNAPMLFIGFVLLLTGEWVMRKRRQLS